MNKLTSKCLKQLLHYNKRTGIFTWKVRAAHRIKIGGTAGSGKKYPMIRIENKLYYAHRLAWLYVTGEWPKDQIDHINGMPSDNRWKNLREASARTNGENKRQAKRENKLGLLGVSKRINTFRARIVVNGREINIGHFSTPQEASTAYVQAKRKYHRGCTI